MSAWIVVADNKGVTVPFTMTVQRDILNETGWYRTNVNEP